MTHELDREITAAVALCRPDGTAAPEAIGWSRRPVHRCVVDRPWGRRKRWHYWAVVTPAEIVSLTVVDLDYAGAIVALWIELATGRTVRDATVRPRGWPGPWPEVADRGDLTLDHRGVAV
ncbi:MAG: DUF2804 family protein, partial [Myxococcales bacterium]|nr:DUF2804 family protein [Myxococcales bacterium]